MKIIETDNFHRDYPDERIIAENIPTKELAQIMCWALITKICDEFYDRYYKIVDDDYILKTGFEP